MLTQEQIAFIKEQYQNGKLKKDIAAAVGCSLATITKYTKEYSVKTDEMVGKTFGLLTVLQRAPKKETKNRCHRYICECVCGNIVEVNGGALRSGHTTSCGCKRKIVAAERVNDLTGQRFGKLVVIQKSENISADRHTLWVCKCDCGNIKEVPSNALVCGDTKSCGCLKSWKELEIAKILEDNNLIYRREVSFEGLVSDTNTKLRFDFGIYQGENLVLLLEYHGDQHYDTENGWYTEKMQKHDLIKKRYCRKNNIPLYVLNKFNNLEEYIERLKKEYAL